MREFGGTFLFSASDLMRFMGCAHATTLDLMHLRGDPRQLPQVIQGAHPEPANLSCIDWMLGDHATIPTDRGIFLPVSRRMHPEVCRFISEQVYEGRLTSHADTARQGLAAPGFPRRGLSGSRSRMRAMLRSRPRRSPRSKPPRPTSCKASGRRRTARTARCARRTSSLSRPTTRR